MSDGCTTLLRKQQCNDKSGFEFLKFNLCSSKPPTPFKIKEIDRNKEMRAKKKTRPFKMHRDSHARLAAQLENVSAFQGNVLPFSDGMKS